jgi:hypothetical protein
LLLTGCFGRGGSDDGARAIAVAPTSNAAPLALTASAAPVDPPTDAQSEPLIRTRLDVLVLTVPFGTVSLNDDFWKRVDETAVSPDTYDVLFKNGVRVGHAPTAEWEFFRQIIAQYPAITQKGDYAGDDGKALEIAVRREIESQTIFYLNAANRLMGRSFERSEDLLSLSFQPAPRRPGALRVALVPMVRSQRVRIEYNAENVGNEVQYVSPEFLYELGLATEIAPDQFMVIAPSREGRWPSSIGNVFLTTDGSAERQERVILLVPRQIALQPVKR